jgi:cytochrome c oxidase assembly protein subunit 15
MPGQAYLLNNHHRSDNVWLQWVALLTAGATFILILVGGLVTSTGSGLAVPDWPTTFGHNMFLYPWSKMVGGIFYEHSHRLVGSAVGLLTLTLALLLWLRESRKWLRWLGVIALGAVIAQGVLGGLRVILLQPTLAILHACFAQAFFALAVSLVLFTSREWQQESQPSFTADTTRLQRLAVLTTSLIYLQLVFGAVLRHTGARLDAHLFIAALVTIQVIWLAAQILTAYADQPKLVRSAVILCGLLILQLALGVGSYLGQFTILGPTRIVLTTAHVVTGALMLAACLVLTLRVYRLRAWSRPVVNRGFVSAGPLGGSEQVPA